MYKLQALKSKASRVAIGTVLAVSLATLGFAPLAFADPGDPGEPAETDVFLYRDGTIAPPDDSEIEKGKHYDIIVPDNGLYGLVSEASAGKHDLEYAPLPSKNYSLELQNNTTFGIYVKNVSVQGNHKGLNILEKDDFADPTETKNTFWTSFGPTGNEIDVKKGLAAGGIDTQPGDVAAWTIPSATQDGQNSVPGTLGIKFKGGIKNVDINMFPSINDTPYGLKAYTIVWTLAFNGNI